MRHLVSGRKLNRTSSHRKALLANLATELFRHKSIRTTEAKAKELRPYAEKLITKARVALQKEKLGKLPAGQSIDIHNRRIVARHIRNKAVLQELFDNIAPAVSERNGGYTRIVKLGFSRGDAAREAVIQLVDFGPEQDGQISIKRKSSKKKQASKAKAKAPKAPKLAVKADKTDNKTEEVVEKVEAKVSEVIEKTEEVIEAKADSVTESTEAKPENEASSTEETV